MAKVRTQILSDESLNTKGFIVLNDGLDWRRYRNNPIMLRNPNTGEHQGQPIGKIVNIRLEKGLWLGDLVFGSSPLARQAEKDYDDGILNAVSIYGPSRIVERNGRRMAIRFEVWEISLVNVPSNPNAVAIRDRNVGLSASVIFNPSYIEEVVSLSAEENKYINQFETKMNEEEIKNQEPEVESLSSGDEKISISALSAIGNVFKKLGLAPGESRATRRRRADELDRDADQDERDARVDREAEDDGEEGRGEEADRDEAMARRDRREARYDRRKADGLSTKEGSKDEEGSEKKEGLSAVPNDTENKQETSKDDVAPTALSVGEDANVLSISQNQTKTKKMATPFRKYITDPNNEAKLQRIVGLSASGPTDDGVVGLSAENGLDNETMDAIQELAASMQADPRFMATVQNMTIDVNGGRRIKATDTIQALASGEKSGQFVQNADLAKVVWLALFVRQLFPSNTWSDRVRRLSVRDKEGIIWVESAIDPEIYFGDRAPIEAPNYLYDDLPRGLERKVFSLQPIVWQSANSDILAYNDVATGTEQAMAKLSTAIHDYWLEVIAESVPAVNQIAMTGTAFDSAGRFPINAAAAGQVNGMTVNDLIGGAGKFIARNFNFRRGTGVAVFSEPYFTSLQQSDEIKSILTQQLSNASPDSFNYGGFQVIARSYIAGYNTATSTVVDAEMYFDKPVTFATGAIDESHTKPVLASTVYDIGLAFIPDEVIVAIGNTNIHMVADPNNYGWKMSMDVSTGAGTLRSGAAGILLFKPTPATTPGA